jgi:hypothetical protein
LLESYLLTFRVLPPPSFTYSSHVITMGAHSATWQGNANQPDQTGI